MGTDDLGTARTFLVVASACACCLGLIVGEASASNAVDAEIVLYDGWGTPNAIVLSGRVLEAKPPTRPKADASPATNLVDNLQALESDEIAGVEVEVAVGGAIHAATTDDDGVFSIEAKAGKQPFRLGLLEVRARVRSPSVRARIVRGRVFVYPNGAFVAIVSDIDDTVVKTYVTDKKRLIATSLLKNALQLEPVEGAAAAYRRAMRHGVRAVFYVSGSPQNYHRRLKIYLAQSGFPAGPVILKNFGQDPIFEQDDYKRRRIEALLTMFPAMSVVLVGDSGERDPEIYMSLRKRHGDRVQGIVIRRLEDGDLRPERFAEMTITETPFPLDVITRVLVPSKI